MATQNIGKWLAYVIALALILFVVIGKAMPEFLDKFTSFVTTILAIVVGVTVIYIIINLKK